VGLTGRLRRVVAPVRRIGARAIPFALKYSAIRENVMRALAANRAHENIPPLEAKHLDNARLFANRKDLISSIPSIQGGVVAEVGVAHGDFSEFLIDQLKPKRFVAFDLFTMHEWGVAWEDTTANLLNNMTHLEFYKRRFADRSAEVVIEVGMSHLTLGKYPNKSFDLIYIDADHRYEAVKKDAEVAKNKVADNGFLIFNDYMRFDHLEGQLYGVVRAVNELIVNDNWVVCGFALQREMYCDIAIHKR
jgi:Methyltransferase domain